MEERRRDPELDGALLVLDDDDDRHGIGGVVDDDDDDDLVRTGSRGRAGDGKAEAAAEILQGMLDRMDLDVRVRIREDEEEVVLDVRGEDAGRAIGKKGQTLDAMQFLVNKVVNRDPHGRRHVVVDSGDYRARHEKGLVSMARREAKRALQNGKVVTLEPMSARDRRVIHLSLAKFPGVSTRSNGEGLERRLQIIPARQRRGRSRRDD